MQETRVVVVSKDDAVLQTVKNTFDQSISATNEPYHILAASSLTELQVSESISKYIIVVIFPKDIRTTLYYDVADLCKRMIDSLYNILSLEKYL